jgi:seryl-tRNA synthetase
MPNVREILAARREELVSKLQPLMEQVRELRETLTTKQNEASKVTLEIQQINSALQAVEETETRARPTIKEAVLEVLKDHADGMTALEILDEINARFFAGRITRTSLSPQLSRLKDDDKKIELRGNTWFLLPPQPNLFVRRL